MNKFLVSFLSINNRGVTQQESFINHLDPILKI